MMASPRWLLALWCVVGPVTLAAQVGRPPVGTVARAMAAERRGDYAEAARDYEALVAERPADGQAILGLSRVLPVMDRRADLARYLAQAIAVDSTNIGFLSLAVRTYALLENRTAARALVDRWAALSPGDEEPYREWALSALEVRDRGAARTALELGRARIDHPAALAAELAQLRQQEGDLAGATSEWLRATAHIPGFRASAVLLLGDVAPEARGEVRKALAADGSAEAQRLEGLLLARWGEPEAGARRLLGALPTTQGAATPVLRAFLEELRGRTDRDAMRARGLVLEALADREVPELAIRTRMEAARAHADGGDEATARRVLGQVAADPLAAGDIATSASTTLLGVLIAEGRAAEAESLYVQLRGALSLDDQEREQRRIALAWARSGNVARGEALLEADSTVTGFDTRGRLRAFAGDLATATAFLRIAGPWDESRDVAASRVRLLALLQAVMVDSLPPLGAALLAIERGDSARAVRELDALAPSLEPPGAAAVRLLAGELAVALGDRRTAERLLGAADVPEAPAVAPAARLALATLYLAAGRRQEADALLERLILDFPDSAAVPDARRARDLLRRTPAGAT